LGTRSFDLKGRARGCIRTVQVCTSQHYPLLCTSSLSFSCNLEPCLRFLLGTLHIASVTPMLDRSRNQYSGMVPMPVACRAMNTGQPATSSPSTTSTTCPGTSPSLSAASPTPTSSPRVPRTSAQPNALVLGPRTSVGLLRGAAGEL
jgi:hypothetical protein